jgi:5-methylcytosine-specific restriction endonuclease McrA
MRTAALHNRTRTMIGHHRDRAKARGRAIDYTLDDLRVKVVCAKQLPCVYCGRPLTDANFSGDHAVPVSRGGSFGLENVEICCKTCNETKGDLTHEEFSALWALLRAWESVARVSVLRRLRAGGKWRRA